MLLLSFLLDFDENHRFIDAFHQIHLSGINYFIFKFLLPPFFLVFYFWTFWIKAFLYFLTRQVNSNVHLLNGTCNSQDEKENQLRQLLVENLGASTEAESPFNFLNDDYSICLSFKESAPIAWSGPSAERYPAWGTCSWYLLTSCCTCTAVTLSSSTSASYLSKWCSAQDNFLDTPLRSFAQVRYFFALFVLGYWKFELLFSQWTLSPFNIGCWSCLWCPGTF